MTEKTDAPTDSAETAASPAEEAAAKKGGKPNAVWMGTAVGIGSAALVAALMYANSRNKKA